MRRSVPDVGLFKGKIVFDDELPEFFFEGLGAVVFAPLGRGKVTGWKYRPRSLFHQGREK